MVWLPLRRRQRFIPFPPWIVRAGLALLGGSLMSGAELASEPAPPAAARRSLSLRQAIELALSHNRTLEKAGLDREVQRFDLRVAQREFSPDVTLTTGARYNPITTFGTETTTRTANGSVAVTQRIPTGGRFALSWDNVATDRSFAVRQVYDSSVFLQFDQPLLRGGGIATSLANLRIARLAERTNVLEFKRSIIVTITNVVLAYRSLLQAQQQAEVSETALTRAREQLRVNRALVDARILAPVEIIQTEADIANREFNLLTAESVRDSARFALVKLLDVERDALFVATEDIAVPLFRLDLETCRQLAFTNRPDYQQTLQGKAAFELAAEVAKNNRLWSLNLNSRYRLAGSDSTFNNAIDRSFSRLNEDWSVGLALQVPFTDLTREQGHVRARSRAQKAAIDVTEITENIEIEVRDALRGIELALRRVKVSAVARELAERKLEIEKGRLQAGRTTNFAIITFQNDLVTARLNEIGAQISYLNALTLLEQTLGTTLAAWGIRIDDTTGGGPARALPSASSP